MGRFVTPLGVVVETSDKAASSIGYKPAEKPKPAAKPKKADAPKDDSPSE